MARNAFDSQASRFVFIVVLPVLVIAFAVVVPVTIPGSPWHKKPRLGLDLQGGVEIVLKPASANGHPATRGEVDRSLTIIRQRIDKLGVSEHDVRKQGSDEIVVQLAGVRDPAAAARLIGRTAQLELYDVASNRLAGPEPTLYALLGQPRSRSSGHSPARWYLFDRRQRLVAGPKPTRAALLRGTRRAPAGYRIFAVPRRTIVLSCNVLNGCPDTTSSARGTVFYLFRHDPGRGVPEMTGRDFKPGSVDYDPEAAYDFTVGLTPEGARKLQRLTERLARRGRAAGRIEYSALVLDDEIESLVGVDYRGSPHGTTGTSVSISGRNPLTVANVAFLLETGSLPVSFREVGRTEVSATLGRDSLQEAKRAALLGVLLVALFLLVLYRVLGLVAIAGLAIYGVFLYALILRLNVTLTLPSFAGVILSIGVAADANVVIFERIKEEVRRGRSVRRAIGIGYSRGFRTIVDAHVVTAITAAMLFLVAATRVRGFAVMLLFGTVLSLVTAVAATRALLGLLADVRRLDDARLVGAGSLPRLRLPAIEFVRLRYLWFGISAAIIAVGAASLATRGLEFGIDFKGGSQMSFTTPQLRTTEDVRRVVEPVGGAASVVQGRGSAEVDRYGSWEVRTTSLTAAQAATLRNALRERLDARAFSVTVVSASFGRQLAWRAVWAVVAALALIVLYVMRRFGLRFAVPVIVALLHDLALTVGVYSLSGREVETSTVAAVLTVLGFSIYDTIIIFDRVRENVRVLLHPTFAAVVNVSLSQTIRRSLATTFITLLPVASLLVFGGVTLKSFAFATLVGVLSGAYSSIFIAAPLASIWKGREPRFARSRAPVVASEAPSAPPEPT